MKRLFALCVLGALALPACKKGPIASIRNPNVYGQEIDYNNMVQGQAVAQLRYWLEANCSCDSTLEWTGDHASQCEKTAKHILVVETRGPYHTALMEYNGSLVDERPSETPPEIPEANSLCPEGGGSADAGAENSVDGETSPEDAEAAEAGGTETPEGNGG